MITEHNRELEKLRRKHFRTVRELKGLQNKGDYDYMSVKTETGTFPLVIKPLANQKIKKTKP